MKFVYFVRNTVFSTALIGALAFFGYAIAQTAEPEPVRSSLGIRLSLDMPQSAVTQPNPFTSNVGLSKSQDSIPLFDAPGIQRRFISNYDQYSKLLVLDESYGQFTGFKTPVAVDPQGFRERLLENQDRSLTRQVYKTELQKTANQQGGSLLQFELPFKAPKAIKSIMGEGGAGLKVNGYRKISFSGTSQWDNSPVQTGAHRISKFPTLNMEQISSFTINGNIGTKITVDVDQDSKQQQSLANKLQLRYKGDEDDVIKSVELGNTNLALPSTKFLGYSQSVQGLFGVKTTAELGGLKLTGIASQEKSSNQSASFRAGADASIRIIRDYQYLDNTYFDLTRRDSVLSLSDLQPGDSITLLQLFYFVQGGDITTGTTAHSCKLFMDPFRLDKDSAELVPGKFKLYDENFRPGARFTLNRTQFYIIMDTPVPPGVALGVYMKYNHPNGDGTSKEVIVGDLSNPNEYILKTILTLNPQPNFVTWNYVWRNVYSLGGPVGDPNNLVVKIFRGNATSSNDLDASDLDHVLAGKSYLNLFQLDRDNNGIIDAYNDQIVDVTNGYVKFPSSHPFADPSLLADSQMVKHIYNDNNLTNRTQDSKYYLYVKTAARQSEFDLGHFDLVPGSESVTLNGSPLTKDVDYQIYYDIGRIKFLTERALDPNADVKVDYQFAPIFTAEKKTLLGLRGEYQFSPNLRVGSTMLYKSEKTTDRIPKIGEEQSKFLNLDADASYSFESMAITKLFDALPFLSTKQPSKVSFDGEIAESKPNPNIQGQASIDDFEGSRDIQALTTTRVGWHLGTAPLSIQETVSPRGKLIWYNPYDQVPIDQIYDNRQAQPGGSNNQNILSLRFIPLGETPNEIQTSWGAIQLGMSQGSYDQTNTEFIEFRMKGKTGRLHVDLGSISEDVNGNDSLNTEDDGTHILKLDQDKGIYGSVNPLGDDWSYNSSDPNTRNIYTHINGTKGNINDPDLNGRPDTEDLNNNYSLDANNNYIEYSSDLRNVSDLDRNSNGWFTLRIPLHDTLSAFRSNPASSFASVLQNVTFIRIWIDGFEKPDTSNDFTKADGMDIAEIDLTRNLWEVQPIRPLEKIRPDSTSIKATVVNTEENTDYRLSHPPAKPFTDPATNITDKEQSLALNFTEITPGDTAFVQLVPFKVEDLTGYKQLQMYVHGDSTRDKLKFFFRFGPDSLNYYEYQTTVQAGWIPSNDVNINFDEITQIKLKRLNYREAVRDSIRDSLISPTAVRDTLTFSDGKFRVSLEPSLTRVKYYAFGVINTNDSLSGDDLSGSLWLDELRVTDVRRDQGTAATISSSITFGDVGSVSGTYSKTDAFFRTLTQADRKDLGSGSSQANYGYSINFALDRFLSANEKVRIPITYSWSKSELSPRLILGSDITVPAELTESQKSTSVNKSFSIGESWGKQTKNPIYTLLLNKFTSSFSWSNSQSSNPVQPLYSSDRYDLKGRYAATSPLRSGLKIFSWMQGMPLVPKRILGTEFNPLPSRISLDGDVTRVTEKTVNFASNDTIQRYTRTFTGRFETGFTPINTLDLGYNMNTTRDLSDPNLLQLSLNPTAAKLGKELNYNQGFTASYKPNILPFITGTNFSFTGSHTENFVQRQLTTDTTLTDIRRISNSKSFSAGATFSLQKIFGQNKKAPKAAVPNVIQGNLKQGTIGQGKDTTSTKDKNKEKDKSKKDKNKNKGNAADTSGIGNKPVFIDSTKGGGVSQNQTMPFTPTTAAAKPDTTSRQTQLSSPDTNNGNQKQNTGPQLSSTAPPTGNQPLLPDTTRLNQSTPLGPWLNSDATNGNQKQNTGPQLSSTAPPTGNQPLLPDTTRPNQSTPLGPWLNSDATKGSQKQNTGPQLNSTAPPTGNQPMPSDTAKPSQSAPLGPWLNSVATKGNQKQNTGPQLSTTAPPAGNQPMPPDTTKPSQSAQLGPWLTPDTSKTNVSRDTSAVTPNQGIAKSGSSPAINDSTKAQMDAKGKGKGKSLANLIEDKKKTFAAIDTTKLSRDSTSTVPDSLRGVNLVKAPAKKRTTESGESFLQMPLNLIRLITDRIDPIQGTFRWDESAQLDGFLERPSFLYRLGLSDNPNAARINASGQGSTQVDALTKSRNYGLRSGIRLLGTVISTGWSYSISDASGRDTRDIATTFPDLGVTLKNINFLIIPKLFSKTTTFDSKYSQKTTKSVFTQHGDISSKTVSRDFSPLAQIHIDWKLLQGMQSTINYSRGTSERIGNTPGITDTTGYHPGALSVHTIDYNVLFDFKTSYSFKGGSKFWFPLLGRVKIQSNMSIDLDINERKTQTRDLNLINLQAPGTDLSTFTDITAQRTDFSVQPQISYNFSANIKGGLNARWTDSNDLKAARKSHIRELGFWVEIRF